MSDEKKREESLNMYLERLFKDIVNWDNGHDYLICVFGNKSDLECLNENNNKREITAKDAYEKMIEFQNKYPKINLLYLGETNALNNKNTQNINQFINYGIELYLQKIKKCKICNLFLPIKVGMIASLQGLTKVPEFNGKLVEVMAYVEQKNRWKVQLVNTKHKKRYLGLSEHNLKPIMQNEETNEQIAENDNNYKNKTQKNKIMLPPWNVF